VYHAAAAFTIAAVAYMDSAGGQNDAIPQDGTAVRGKIQQMELRSIVWNFASRIFARIVRQPCKNCGTGAKLCKMTKYGAPAVPPTC